MPLEVPILRAIRTPIEPARPTELAVGCSEVNALINSFVGDLPSWTAATAVLGPADEAFQSRFKTIARNALWDFELFQGGLSDATALVRDRSAMYSGIVRALSVEVAAMIQEGLEWEGTLDRRRTAIVSRVYSDLQYGHLAAGVLDHGLGPIITAHRGARYNAPENTLFAFAETLRLGVGRVEFDVLPSGTGEIAVCSRHDLDLTTDGHGPVFEAGYYELNRLRTKGPNGPDAEHQLPYLDEIFMSFGDLLEYEIEFKWPDLEFAERVIRLAQEFELLDRIEFTTSDLALIGALQAKSGPAIVSANLVWSPTGITAASYPEYLKTMLKASGAQGAHLIMKSLQGIFGSSEAGVQAQTRLIGDLVDAGYLVSVHCTTEDEHRTALRIKAPRILSDDIATAVALRA